MEMLVLALLSESDLYGNQFPQLISKYSGGVIVIPGRVLISVAVSLGR